MDQVGNKKPNLYFSVQSIRIEKGFTEVFHFISEPENLPKWTKAFSKADSESAHLETPQGKLLIKLKTDSSLDKGTIDWEMTMPDGTIGKAYSRIVEYGKSSIYTFVLLDPPVALEQLEGTFETQKNQLKEELTKVKEILEP